MTMSSTISGVLLITMVNNKPFPCYLRACKHCNIIFKATYKGCKVCDKCRKENEKLRVIRIKKTRKRKLLLHI
jgi:hypothetical protein